MTIPHIQGFIMKLDDIIKHLENLKATDPRFEQDLLDIEIDIYCESGNIYVASQVQGEPTIDDQCEARAEAIENLNYALRYAFEDFGIDDPNWNCAYIADALFTQFSFDNFVKLSKEYAISYKDGDDKRIFERIVPSAQKAGLISK